MTYVHRGLSFESALLDAMMKIEEGSENILVGAIDEMTETSYIIQQRLGLLKGNRSRRRRSILPIKPGSRRASVSRNTRT